MCLMQRVFQIQTEAQPIIDEAVILYFSPFQRSFKVSVVDLHSTQTSKTNEPKASAERPFGELQVPKAKRKITETHQHSVKQFPFF
jgi:hypothetical protein